MKFEQKYPRTIANEQMVFRTTTMRKMRGLVQCDHCGCFTKWQDMVLNKHACSEECVEVLWQNHLADNPEANRQHLYSLFENEIQTEITGIDQYRMITKDIIIVVKDQLDYVKKCIESVAKYTKAYRLYIWDNGSEDETKRYLQQLSFVADGTVEVFHSDINVGFIMPNNELAGWGNSEYIILLNSDTLVSDGWDAALIKCLREQVDIGVVGYMGGLLDAFGKGTKPTFGGEIDYVMGWCLALSRENFDKFGLFNKQLTFAYCEDADLSLRLSEAGLKPFALHAPMVHHFGNKTITAVASEGQVDVKKTFDLNHQYMQVRWKDYLQNRRILARRQ